MMERLWLLNGRRLTTAALRRLGIAAGNEMAVGAIPLAPVPPVIDPALQVYIDGGVTVIDGQAYVNWLIDAAPVEDARAAMKRRVAALRWERETAGITVEGRAVQTDRESRNVMATSLMVGWRDGGVWKFGDGAFAALSATDFEDLVRAVTNHVRACYDREAELVAAIDAAETVAALGEIPVTDGWP